VDNTSPSPAASNIIVVIASTRARGQETVNLLQNTPRAHFTDEVNYIIDNEKQKAFRVVGVRSARACVTMPSAAN
jgi:hypothetical protein